ncbi:PREDICTED: EH domain-binding protein 1-like protein 1 isoform X3 [Papilio xuthus]|uniref:EH domain-binding protein 1-like protein 1 isoform X3 n=1 Tax=Papilio xuthus TaxID=66420 RepID=A0AAJ6ZT93_PAPXU|nr:PREDICTED: EH domain-binding protein 1-like protein 1 isoform X3 [Papilio xuthus]
MASVWKRLQRVNKRAAKFQYTASYHRIDVETTPKWKPNKLSIVWTRRSRRVVTEPVEWEPSLKDPLKGSVIFTVPENQTVTVTLFRDPRTNELEDKDWTFVLEDVSPTGKRRRLAAAALDLRKHASLAAAQRAVRVQLDPTGRRLRAASLHLTLHSVLLREGHATDEDMQSLASLLSVNNNSDIAVLEDLDEDDYTLSDNSTRQMLDLRQQMEEMTQSLTNSDIAATPNSVQSLNFDNSATPTAPITPTTDTPTNPATPTSPATPTPNNKDIDFTQKETNIKRPEYNFTKMTIKTEPPKFTSTPKAEEPTLDNFKAMQFKPKTIAKKNLKPLELKSNLNNISLDTNENEKGGDSEKTPVVDMEKLFPLKNLDKDKTPVQDLLEWCQSVTREYRACRITNLTTSFRSGLAFCAIIHRFRPDLIDFSGLQPEEAERNLRVALEASARLGISQVLSAADVCAPPAPDKLAIMTYLFQLRAHFTGSELQVEQLGNDETESSYLVGRHDTDGAVPRDLFSREVSERRSRMRTRPRPNSQDSDTKSQERSSPEKAQSPAAMKEVRDMLVHQSKTILGKMLSPARDLKTSQPNTKWFADPPTLPEAIPARPEKLMTRKELTDPFGSDEEEEPAPPPAQETISTDTVKAESKPTIEPAVTDPLTSAHEASPPPQTSPQQEDQAAVPDLPKPTPPMTEEERQAMLRERARKLIADARAGIVSPTSPLSPSRSRGTVEIISKQSVMEELAAAGGVEQLEALAARGDTPPTPGSRSYGSADRSEERESESRSMSPGGGARRSPLHSFSALVDRLAPADAAPDEGKESGSYIASELEALEREQSAVDERAAALEKQLRRVMESADNTELKKWKKIFLACTRTPYNPEEDRLMSQWFHLVNKKNALLRRQMQLNILEQEEDLSRRCELLARELRLSLAVDEWRKTPGQKRRERLLLQELLSAVNERDRLVQEMDEQEKAIAEDDEIERNLSNVEIQRKNNCILQ